MDQNQKKLKSQVNLYIGGQVKNKNPVQFKNSGLFRRNFYPYRFFNKTNNEINYIHKQSNYLPSIIMQLPLSVERRLRKLSSNEKIFNDSIPTYQETLIKSGNNHKLTYQRHDQKKDNSQQRKKTNHLV